MKKLLKKIFFSFFDLIQSVPFYTPLMKRFLGNVDYVIADDEKLRKYSRWIYKTPNLRLLAIEDKRTYLLALLKSGFFIGSVMLHESNKHDIGNSNIILYSLYVRKFFRRLGIGHQLTIKAMLLARQKGYEKIFLTTGEKNYKARQLYRNIGYKEIEYKELSLFYKKEVDSYKPKKMIPHIYHLDQFNISC